MQNDPLSLIDDIYEAAVIPERWTNVMHSLTAVGRGAFTSMIVLRDNQMSFVGTPEAEKLIGEYQALGKPNYNSRIPRSEAFQGIGFHTDLDVFTLEEIDNDEFYRDFLRPRGYGWITGAWVRPPSGELINVSVEGRRENGPFQPAQVDALNSLFPHLARSALLSSRLQLQRARAMASALELVGLPAAVLRHSGKLYAANPSFERLMPSVIQDRRDRIMFANMNADVLLADTLARLASDGVDGQSRSVAIPASEAQVPLIMHILPVRGAANDIFSQGLALLIVTPVDRKAVPTAEVLQGLFDLTPAEARVARGIAEGKTIEAIALAHGLSRETIRTQLAAVLGKTGLNRQAELVALLSGKGPLGSV